MVSHALRARVIVALLASVSCSAANAIDVFIENGGFPLEWPTSGGVITGTDESIFSSVERAGQSPHFLSQTFQVDTQFDLSSLFIPYRNKLENGSPGTGIQIFSVADVNATTLPLAPSPGDILFDTTFDAPSTLSSLEPANGERVIAQLVLDSPLTLPATTGTAGYALRFLDAPPGEFRWYRTGSAGGDIYAGGKAYENLVEENLGLRDFGLVLSTQGAPTPPVDAFSVQSGSVNSGSTWDTGQPPALGFIYNVSATHTVTVDSTLFNGNGVVVLDGGTLDLARSFANLNSIEVRAGGSLVTSMTGDVGIGDINAAQLMRLTIDSDVSINANANRDVFIDATLRGAGDLNVQGNGAASDLFLTAAGSHEGVIRFNGNGGRVEIVETEAFNILEMNSTGSNTVFFDPGAQTSSTALIFNQPGTVIHAATGQRRQSVDRLEANANVTVDLTTLPTGSPLRWRNLNELNGTGDVSVMGTATAPIDGDNNEFEVGGAGEPPILRVNNYSGTLSGSGFVDLEIHNSLPNARVVIGANATVEMGHRAIIAAHSIAFGEVEVASGGTLVVGFAEGDRHNAHTLRVTSGGTRSGDLTMSAGSTVVMQLNGTGDGEFDTIVADGDISLAGQLDLLINPIATTGTEGENSIYAPTLGDTFELISVGPGPTEGDYTGDGIVDDADYDAWVATFGSTVDLAADGNNNGIIDAGDYTIWRDNEGDQGAITGSLSGSLSLNIVDPGGVLAAAGLTLQLSTTATSLQVEVISATSVSVPEPSGFVSVLLASALLLPKRRLARSCS